MAAPNSHIRVAGIWKPINKMHVRVAGVWKEITKAYVRVGGAWKLILNAEPPVVPGSTTYSTPGTYSFTVPSHNSLVVELRGGGASGFCASATPGNAGGASTFGTGLTANGAPAPTVRTSTGPGGTGVGGDTNVTGGTGEAGTGSYGGAGGAGANGGGAGGARRTTAGWGLNGAAPGGGGGGNMIAGKAFIGGGAGGGGGGYTKKTYSKGTFAYNSTVTLVVGAGAPYAGPGDPRSGTGGAGRAVITWS